MTRKISINKPYIRVGRVNCTIARKAHIKAADIYISSNYLTHITNKHGNELAGLGFDALTFVKAVCQNFNQIRKGSGDSYLLVVYNEEMSQVAAIRLNYALKKGFWEIKTAEPRNGAAVRRKTLIWSVAQADGGNGNRLR